MNVILFGATGQIGHGALTVCLGDPDVERVVAVGRRPTGRSHDKLEELEHGDFTDFSPVKQQLAGFDVCLWCLGVSAAGLTEDAYRRVTHEFTLAAARALLEASPDVAFLFVSGAGAKRGSRTMWARVKAATEDDLAELPLKTAVAMRPAMVFPVDGARSQTRSYRIMYLLLRPLRPVLTWLFRKQVITTRELGEAMLTLARSGQARGTLESGDLVALASGRVGSEDPPP